MNPDILIVAALVTYDDFDPVHYYCDCSPADGLCGHELDPDEGDAPEGVGFDCNICADLAIQPCPKCGE